LLKEVTDSSNQDKPLVLEFQIEPELRSVGIYGESGKPETLVRRKPSLEQGENYWGEYIITKR